jgi:DNA-binding NarL/FixJ family response regulator
LWFSDPCGKPLTQIELEILKLVSQGHTYAEIARIRKRALQTVKNQGCVMLLKLGAYNSAHAVAIGKDRGLI